ncbi:MAG: leucyl/phenylalanyl-tRNA--protein transferase [Bacteroidota bacterium]
MNFHFLNEELVFPSVEEANEYGILAVGGDLSIERLILAYQSGIFPWFSEGEPIVWWAPHPRFVLYPSALKVSKSMRQVLRQDKFRVSYDTAFIEVLKSCQQIKRKGQQGTWITDEMIEAYSQLHDLGYAHSVEVWQENELVGGLYGVSLGKCFYGESMFAKVSNASKVGFITLVQKLEKLDFQIIDCQVHTHHLESLGAVLIPRYQFMQQLEMALSFDSFVGSWTSLDDAS